VLLVVEVGNTNTKIGVFEGPRLLVSWRLTSRREQTADEYGLFIETLLQTRGIQAASVHGISISNVVPPVHQTLEWMCEQYFGQPGFFVEPGVNTRLPLLVDAPREVGADRYVDAFAATAKYGPPLIVIDFGTATTFNCVNARGEFIGGAIAPGIVTSVVETCTVLLDQRHLDGEKLAVMLQEAKEASQLFAREEDVEVEWERVWRIDPILFDESLIELADEAVTEVAGRSHRLPSGPLHDAAEVARAGVPTVMLFVQSLRGLSHTKLEDTKPEHLELSVTALDRLAAKTIDRLAAG